jgi:hypothetical protein
VNPHAVTPSSLTHTSRSSLRAGSAGGGSIMSRRTPSVPTIAQNEGGRFGPGRPTVDDMSQMRPRSSTVTPPGSDGRKPVFHPDHLIQHSVSREEVEKLVPPLVPEEHTPIAQLREPLKDTELAGAISH